MAKKKKTILAVEIREAKENALFSEDQRASVRFLIYNQKIACAECGRKVKIMWTMLCQFKAMSMGSTSVIESEKSHPPLTPVCGEHPLAADFPKVRREIRFET